MKMQCRRVDLMARREKVGQIVLKPGKSRITWGGGFPERLRTLVALSGRLSKPACPYTRM